MSKERFVCSDAGVKVYKKPEWHPLLARKDLSHPDFLRKAEETFPRGRVKGLPRICSENSEDARTWHYFSPLLSPSEQTGRWLRAFLERALEGRASVMALDSTSNPQLRFWHGRKTPENMYYPPESRTRREGPTEVDLTIQLEHQALVFVEAKYQSDITTSTKYDARRDQIIRNVDVGSWHARQRGFKEFYFILITDDRDPDKAYTRTLGQYMFRPQGLKAALPYRDDLAQDDFVALARHIGWITWGELPKRTDP